MKITIFFIMWASCILATANRNSDEMTHHILGELIEKLSRKPIGSDEVIQGLLDSILKKHKHDQKIPSNFSIDISEARKYCEEVVRSKFDTYSYVLDQRIAQAMTTPNQLRRGRYDNLIQIFDMDFLERRSCFDLFEKLKQASGPNKDIILTFKIFGKEYLVTVPALHLCLANMQFPSPSGPHDITRIDERQGQLSKEIEDDYYQGIEEEYLTCLDLIQGSEEGVVKLDVLVETFINIFDEGRYWSAFQELFDVCLSLSEQHVMEYKELGIILSVYKNLGNQEESRVYKMKGFEMTVSGPNTVTIKPANPFRLPAMHTVQ